MDVEKNHISQGRERLPEKPLAELLAVDLSDKYTKSTGRVFLNGTQALVRLMMMQSQRDQQAGHRTAGLISGYRGSPLGALDLELSRLKPMLDDHALRFQPGLNEDLAATALWGSQQLGLFEKPQVEGVFGLWYGKGPGVDRSGDVFRHANMAGTAPLGGVLAVAGDDHGAKSSTTAHQSDYAFVDAMIPLLSPASVAEYLLFGLIGFAMSRFAGCWASMKTVADTVETSASVNLGDLPTITLPDIEIPPGGLHIRWPHTPLEQEELLHRYRLPAAQAFARVNQLNHIYFKRNNKKPARLGLIAAGKSYMDCRQALDDLGISEELAQDIGISLYKPGMVWPLDKAEIQTFAKGLDEILVIEEKRPLIEGQVRDLLYPLPAGERPAVLGKIDLEDQPLFPTWGEINATAIAKVIAARLQKLVPDGLDQYSDVQARIKRLETKESSAKASTALAPRTPYFCAGCPHNSSTKVPEGSTALAGIGCHYMAIWMDRETCTYTHMGGEGASWIGQAPFTDRPHVFANLGDGTYNHSGLMAIRAAVAAKVNITYKILYNDAVAMTGGQSHDGALQVDDIARQLLAIGVKRVVITSEDPARQRARSLPPDVPVYDRRDLDRVQRELREIEGVSALIHDQTCAAEKRRRRKRGTYPDPNRRLYINHRVCEGCGDCGIQSNCIAINPLDTAFGRKRRIDQSACNKDYACGEGFCPSFVFVEGAAKNTSQKPETQKSNHAVSPDIIGQPPGPPVLPSVDEKIYNILITGVGGTGVVTLGAILGMAAHMEGKGVTVLDMAGLAQKGGPVISHIRIGKTPESIHSNRVGSAQADLLLGCDLMVAASPAGLDAIDSERTRAIINLDTAITGDFTRNPEWTFPQNKYVDALVEKSVADQCDFPAASDLVARLLGDQQFVNIFMLGYAFQKGQLPLSRASIEAAIRLNGVRIEQNIAAFNGGALAANDLDNLLDKLAPTQATSKTPDISSDDIIAHYAAELTAYQSNRQLPEKFNALVDKARQIEEKLNLSKGDLSQPVAFSYFRVLAVKDEYEVARLLTSPEFIHSLQSDLGKGGRISYLLAPPFLRQIDPITGRPRKRRFGPWLYPFLRVLSSMRRFRDGPFDLLQYSHERRVSTRLRLWFETEISDHLDMLTRQSLPAFLDRLREYDHVRGYGPVKIKNFENFAPPSYNSANI